MSLICNAFIVNSDVYSRYLILQAKYNFNEQLFTFINVIN